jgi:hypothetical protein
LVGVFVKEQMEVPKAPAGHVPVEILGLQIETEDIGQHCLQRFADLLDALIRNACVSPVVFHGWCRTLLIYAFFSATLSL